MTSIGTLELEIVADARKLRSGMSGAASAIKGFAVAAGAAFTAVALRAIKAASDAEEVSGKFNVVFRDVSRDAKAAAKDLQESYDLSSTESRRLLANTGDLLTGFGFTQDAALDLSKQVQSLSADLASFNNLEGGAAEASRALTAGLLGERESMKRLGIAINETTPEWKAMLAEVEQTTGAVGAQAKALATLRLAQLQSANAAGDYARTQGTVANQTRALEADIQDLQESLGKELLPAARMTLESLRELLTDAGGDSFEGLKDAIAGAIVGFKTLGAAIGTAVSGAAFGAAKLQELILSATGFSDEAAEMAVQAERFKIAAEEGLDKISMEGVAKSYHDIRTSMQSTAADAGKQTKEIKQQTQELEKQKKIQEGTFATFARSRFRFGATGRAGPLTTRGTAGSVAGSPTGALVEGMFAPRAGQAEAQAELDRIRRHGTSGIRNRATAANLNAFGGLVDARMTRFGFGRTVDESDLQGGVGLTGVRGLAGNKEGTQAVLQKLDQLIDVTRQGAKPRYQ